MANIKDFAKGKELFTGGHRACTGCGAVIIARQVLMVAGPNTVIANATGCLEVVSTIFPYTAWNVPFIHSAFENAAATISGVEALHKSWTRQGKYDKKVNFIAFGGDGGSYDIGLQSLSGAVERGHNILYVCYNNEAYMNCLSTSSMIMMKDGLKKITDIREGDDIYAFDQKTHQLVLKKCSGVFDNGVKDVYELSTAHHTIKATSSHPFLILKRNGRGRKREFVWNTLEEIKMGDEVVALKNIDLTKSHEFDFRKSEKGDYNVDKYPNQCRYNNPLVDNDYFDTEKVVSVKLVGKEPTLDLRVEGEHNFIADGIVVHNTGVQRSGATPKGADTTTAPVGKVKRGKEQYRKDLTEIIVAHKIPYVAQAIAGNWRDLTSKVEKALSIEGPKFINVFQPCRLGWSYEPELTCELGRIAVEACVWPLYEVTNGQYRLTYRPKEKRPIAEWIKLQGRFRHLLKPENKDLLDEIQVITDKNWEELLKKEGASQTPKEEKKPA